MNRLRIVSNHLSEPLVQVQILPDRVAIITLKRPEKLNALSLDL